ncbi:MAG TPA: TonB-dependent receptor [Bacteroidales bacterium]|nr:TonB-dependent receptor [Bacteroidales bacterium]
MNRLRLHKRGVLIFLFISFLLIRNQAQHLSDTLNLKEVEIRAGFSVDNQGFKRVRLDSLLLVPYLNADLSTILSEHSSIFIKSYGNGSLSTPAFRGTSANHTQVEWNGISINSPMLGQSDLSQVPVAQFDGIEILYGAAGIARTSGAFGGVINLVTNPDWNNRVNVMAAQTVASFNTFTTNASAAVGNSSVQSITKVNYTNSVNDFPYYNDYTQKREIQKNASYDLLGFTEEAFFRIGDHHFIAARAWYNQSNHDIPPPTTNTLNNYNEYQDDRSLKGILEWKYLIKDFNLTARSAMVDQYMHYVSESDTNALEAHHHSYSWVNRVRASWTGVKNLSIKPGVDLNKDWVVSDAYEGLKTRLTLSAFAECTYDILKKAEISLVMREDVIDGKFLPFIPALGVEYHPFNKVNLSFSANVSRNYRYPTLNDLYWAVYGNPDLQPETDYAAEAGTVYNIGTSNRRLFIEMGLSGYYSLLDNLIVWVPTGGSAEFRPQNVKQVLSRGIESGINLTANLWGMNLKWNSTYNFCRSTYEKTAIPGDSSVGNQQMYIPVHTFNITLTLAKWNFYLTYNNSYTGRRYTDPSNETYMPAYDLSNIIFGKNFHLKKFILSLQLQVNNLFDLDYQSIANRPMPGRNFALTVRCDFKK